VKSRAPRIIASVSPKRDSRDDLVRVPGKRRRTIRCIYIACCTPAGKATGLPVLYNTSFNLFRRPAGLCTPRGRVRQLFIPSAFDALFAGNFFIEK